MISNLIFLSDHTGGAGGRDVPWPISAPQIVLKFKIPISNSILHEVRMLQVTVTAVGPGIRRSLFSSAVVMGPNHTADRANLVT